MSNVNEQIEKVRSLARDLSFDAVVASSMENFYYVSGTYFQALKTIPDRLGFVIVPVQGEPTMIVCDVQELAARRTAQLADIRPYTEFKDAPTQVLAEVLRERGLDTGRIGIEKKHLVAMFYEELLSAGRTVQWESAEPVFREARLVKTQREIDQLQHAARQTELAAQNAFGESRRGDSERTVANRIAHQLIDLGCTNHPHAILSSGKNTLVNHHPSGPKPVEAGDVIRVDFGGAFGPYLADLARMAVVSEPNDRQRAAYTRARDIQRQTIARMRPGMTAGDIFRYCVDVSERGPLDMFMPHIGHGVGLTLHEDPILQPRDETPMRPGMVLNVEPIFRDGDDAAYTIEDLVLITDGEPLILSDAVPTEEMFVVQ
jgi:Xaa-Pro aminopeptidase